METKTVMKVDSKELGRALKVIAPAIRPNNPTAPALDAVYIQPDCVTGGNMEISITVPFNSELEPMLLEFQTLQKATDLLSGQLTLNPVKEAVELKAIGGKISVPVVGPVSDYPQIKSDVSHPEFVLTKSEIVEISKLNLFIDPKKTFAIFFNGKYFAATNNMIAAVYYTSFEVDYKAAFYPELFKSLAAIDAEKFYFTDGIVLAKTGDYQVAEIKYRLTNENAPEFDRVMPSSLPVSFNIKTYDFNRMLSVLTVGANVSVNHAKLTLTENALTGEAGWVEVNKASEYEIEAETTGYTEPLSIGIVIKQMESVANFLNNETLEAGITAFNRPMLFQANNKKCLVMPVMI